MCLERKVAVTYAQKLSFGGVDGERGHGLHNIKKTHKKGPDGTNVAGGDGQIITHAKQGGLIRGNLGRDPPENWVISKDKQNHTGGVTLFDTTINLYGTVDFASKFDIACAVAV